MTATAKDSGSGDLGASIALEWQRIAQRTMFVDSQPATPVPASPLYFGFSSLAMDAAVTSARGQGMSASAAAAVAAHDVLVEYFPASTTKLDADLATSLSKIPDGRAKRSGIEIGGAAADKMVASRKGDGRNSDHPYTVTPRRASGSHPQRGWRWPGWAS